MNTNEKLKMVATKHFGQYGYKGTSLAKIAEEVGIKKPSLYAHYDSKQALFEACMDGAMAEFKSDAKKMLHTEKSSAAEVLYNFPAGFISSNSNADDSRFFYLRFAYMPPEDLGENMIRYSNDFIEALAEIVYKPIDRLLNEVNNTSDKPEEILEAYLCIFDGLMVELLFGGTKGYSKRLDAAWAVFLKGVR